MNANITPETMVQPVLAALQPAPAALQLAGLFKALSQPVRIEILLAIGSGEACVCHLEAALGQRQAYISQHLMALREAGLLEARRDGRFIYYRLAGGRLLPLIHAAAELLEFHPGALPAISGALPTGCECPHCAPDLNEQGA
ncbi:MAG: ArsR/SmtB family transcription factor [Chloroflexota bacterium]